MTDTYKVTVRGILAPEFAETIAAQIRVGMPGTMAVEVSDDTEDYELRNAHSDQLAVDGTCEREGCLVHRSEADERPTGGDGDPSFPGGLGCGGHTVMILGGDVGNHVPCHTLWATSESLAAHLATSGHEE